MSTIAPSSTRESIIGALAALPPDALIDEAGLAGIFKRHPVSVRRAIRRGELPPGVRLMGRPTWTAKAILDHLNHRLEEARKEREKNFQRFSKLRA